MSVKVLQHTNKITMSSAINYGCAECFIKLEKNEIKRCSNCHTVVYCSKECQKKHWKEDHKDKCKLLSSTTMNKTGNDYDKLSAMQYWMKKYPAKYEKMISELKTKARDSYDWVFIEEIKDGDSDYTFVLNIDADKILKEKLTNADENKQVSDHIKQSKSGIVLIFKTLHPLVPLSYAKIGFA